MIIANFKIRGASFVSGSEVIMMSERGITLRYDNRDIKIDP